MTTNCRMFRPRNCIQNSFICSLQKAYVAKSILQPHRHVWSTGHRVDQGRGHRQAKPTQCLKSTWLHWTKNLRDIWELCLALFPDNGNSMLPKRWKHSINWIVCANILTSLEYLSTQVKPPALLPLHTIIYYTLLPLPTNLPLEVQFYFLAVNHSHNGQCKYSFHAKLSCWTLLALTFQRPPYYCQSYDLSPDYRILYW